MLSTMEDRPVSPEGGRSSGQDRAGPGGQAPAVELRVHGVGGSTPEGLLGVASAAETVRVGGGPISGFWARRDEPDVEGHVWGGLTTQSTFQPLWLLLLPLTLLNIAGFMHHGGRDTWPVQVQRRVLRVLGYVLTAAWALWTSTIVIEQLALRGLGLPAVAKVVLGALVCLALLAGGFFIARHTAKEFEGVAPPQEVRDHAPDGESRWLLEDRDFFAARSSAAEKAGRSLAEDGTEVPWRQWWTGQEVVAHVWLAAVVILVAAGRALSRVLGEGSTPAEPIGIGALLVPVLTVQLVLLGVLGVASAAETLPRLRSLLRPDRVRRWLGPFGAAALAVGLTQLSFGGVAVFVGNRLGLNAELAESMGLPLADAAARPEQAIADVVGLAILAAVVGAVALVAGHYPLRPGNLPAWVEPIPASRLAGLPSEGWARRVARARTLTRAVGRIGWVLVPPAVAVFAFGALKLWPRPGGRFATWGDLAAGRLAPQGCTGGGVRAAADWLTTGCGGPGVAPTWLGSAGAWIIGLALVGGPIALYRASRSPRVRALVGTLWDVLTFWPRWHHPFAVRSYAERVVPELQHRIVGHVTRDHAGAPLPEGRYRPLVLSVHSQGTVLAFAALASLPAGIARLVRVVSFGSPLSTLYARFYPAYFGHPDHAGDGPAGGFRRAVARAGEWVNLYRLTDYVGQEVVGVGDQRLLADPYPDTDDPWPAISPRVDEAPCLPWTHINGHSGYRREPAVRAAVTAARSEVRAALGAPG